MATTATAADTGYDNTIATTIRYMIHMMAMIHDVHGAIHTIRLRLRHTMCYDTTIRMLLIHDTIHDSHDADDVYMNIYATTATATTFTATMSRRTIRPRRPRIYGHDSYDAAFTHYDATILVYRCHMSR
jgi:hypothetical protein